MQKILFIFALLLLVGSSAMAQKTGKKPRTAEDVIVQNSPLKSMSFGNMSVGKVKTNANQKGNFVSRTGVNIEWTVMYNSDTKQVTMFKIEADRPQSAAFWNAQMPALDKPEVYKALEACLSKDDAKNFAPCMQATIQANMK